VKNATPPKDKKRKIQSDSTDTSTINEELPEIPMQDVPDDTKERSKVIFY
jgi:hypothetical protein